jgi:tetratricopeptide (TPR) repeat protein
MRAYHGLGLLALRQGDLPAAISLLERALGICQEADLPAWFSWMATTLGAAYTQSGRIADAVLLLTQALEQAHAMSRAWHGLCNLSLSESQMLAGRLQEAHALAGRALTLTRQYQERGNEAYALRLLGEIAVRRDPSHAEQVVDDYRQALTLANELGMRPLQAHCHFDLGVLYGQMGLVDHARAELTVAIDLYRTMEMTLRLPQAEAILTQVERR